MKRNVLIALACIGIVLAAFIIAQRPIPVESGALIVSVPDVAGNSHLANLNGAATATINLIVGGIIGFLSLITLSDALRGKKEEHPRSTNGCV